MLEVYHAYRDIWSAVEGQVLLQKRKPDNCKVKYTVVIMIEDRVVGQVPHNLAQRIYQGKVLLK